MSGLDIPPSQLPEIAYDVLVNRYTIVSTVSILVYDYFLTLEDESRYIWPLSFSISKAIYLLNRYVPFIASVFIIHFTILNRNHSLCLAGFFTGVGFVFAGYVIAEAILFLRVWAIWSRDRWIFALLSTLFVTFVSISVYFNTIFLGAVVSPDIVFFNGGCSFSFGSRADWINVAALLVCETVSVSLLVYKAVRTVRHSASHLLILMYHDGILYFICILAISVANLVVVRAASPMLCNVLLFSQSIFHSILCNRLLLRMRGNSASVDFHDETTTEDNTRMSFYMPPRVSTSSRSRSTRSGAQSTEWYYEMEPI